MNIKLKNSIKQINKILGNETEVAFTLDSSFIYYLKLVAVAVAAVCWGVCICHGTQVQEDNFQELSFSLHRGFHRSNSDHQAYTVSTLPTKQSQRPYFYFLKWGLGMQARLDLNSWSFCLCSLSAEAKVCTTTTGLKFHTDCWRVLDTNGFWAPF